MHFTSPKGYNREIEYPLRIKRQEFDDSSTQCVTLQEPLTLFTKNEFVTNNQMPEVYKTLSTKTLYLLFLQIVQRDSRGSCEL